MFIRRVFKLPLRQTEGFMISIVQVMKTRIAIPDFSSISMRSVELPRFLINKAMKPGNVVIVDSAGLNVYRKDEWHQKNHAVPTRRTWRKLHLAVDEKHQIMGCKLTTPEVGDPAAVPDLLAQIPPDFEIFMGEGAYDGDPVLQAVQTKKAQRHGDYSTAQDGGPLKR